MTTYHKPQPGRNYGERSSGGDAYAMGRALNEAIKTEWQVMHRYRKEAAEYLPGNVLRDFKIDMARTHKFQLRQLCIIRHAARTSA